MTVEPFQATSMLMVRVGNEDFPLKTETNCHTCQSPHRLLIEREILRGRGYAHIARMLADLPEGDHPHPDRRALARHVKRGHLPGPAQARAALIHRRAEQMGVSILDAEDLINEVVVADMVLHAGAERLASGEIKPSVTETLAAAKLLRDFNTEADQNFEMEALTESVMRFYEIAQQMMGEETFKEFLVVLRKDPVLRAIRAKQEARQREEPDEDIMDVDYTEDEES